MVAEINAYRQVDPQFELYNLTADPYEQTNLAYAANETAQSKEVRPRLQQMLDEHRERKCLAPRIKEGAPRAGGEGLVDYDRPQHRDARRERQAAPPPPA